MRLSSAAIILLLGALLSVANGQRILLQYESGAKDQVIAALSKSGFEVDIDYAAGNILAVKKQGSPSYTGKPASATLISSLAGLAKVKHAEQDVIVQKHCTNPNTPGTEYLPYGIQSVQANLSPLADAAAQANVKSRIVLCSIDDGLDTTHSDISSKNNLTGSPTPYAWNSPSSGQSHGTHTSGTMIGASNTGGLVGVITAGANIFMHNVFGPTEGAYTSDIIKGWQFCEGHLNRWKSSNAGTSSEKKLVINMSLGGAGTMGTTAKNEIDRLYNRGDILLFASSGNSGKREASYPAAYTNVISVAAIDAANKWATFSTYHSTVELTAPGVSVMSTVSSTYNDRAPLSGDPFLTVTTGPTVDTFPPSTILTGSGTGTASGNLVDCGTGETTCSGATGRICLISRGSNTFCLKMNACKSGGGLAAIIYNNVANDCEALLGDMTGVSGCSVTDAIPTIGLSKSQGLALKNAAIGVSNVVVTVKGSADLPAFASWDGTSMSCPHATATAALVWAQWPACKGPRIRQALQSSALDITASPAATGRDVYTGFGLVRAKAAHEWLTTNGCGTAIADFVCS